MNPPCGGGLPDDGRKARAHGHGERSAPLLLAALLVGRPCGGQDCGVESLCAIARLLGHEVSPAARQKLNQVLPGERVTMLQIQAAAAELGITLAGVRAPLRGLLAQGRGPSIIHLQEPDHFLTLARASDEWVQAVDSGRVALLARSAIEARYSGRALVPALPDPAGAPRAEVADFCWVFGVAGVGQQVRHVFEVLNAGAQDLTVRTREEGG
jgi:hypothetical protein